MKFTVAATIISLSSLITAINLTWAQPDCESKERFGVMTVSPRAVFNAGDSITISVNFPCTSDEEYKTTPKLLHYTIEALSGSATLAVSGEPIFLANREFQAGSTSDNFTMQVPPGTYFFDSIYAVTLTGSYVTTVTPSIKLKEMIVDARVINYILIKTPNDEFY